MGSHVTATLLQAALAFKAVLDKCVPYCFVAVSFWDSGYIQCPCVLAGATLRAGRCASCKLSCLRASLRSLSQSKLQRLDWDDPRCCRRLVTLGWGKQRGQRAKCSPVSMSLTAQVNTEPSAPHPAQPTGWVTGGRCCIQAPWH